MKQNILKEIQDRVDYLSDLNSLHTAITEKDAQYPIAIRPMFAMVILNAIAPFASRIEFVEGSHILIQYSSSVLGPELVENMKKAGVIEHKQLDLAGKKGFQLVLDQNILNGFLEFIHDTDELVMA